MTYDPPMMRALCLVALVGCASGKLAVDRVDPASAPNTAPVPVQIVGTGFHLAITSSLDHDTPVVGAMTVAIGDVSLDDAVWRGEQLLEGTVPAGLAEGSYDVTVAIGGHSAVLAGGYTVANPHPEVDAGIDAGIDAPPRLCTTGKPDGEGHCFIYHATPANYADATLACAADGTHLAIIQDAVQNAIAYSLVTSTNTFIGLTDQVLEGTMVWPDGVVERVGATLLAYDNFRSGEPNNGAGMYEEDCVVIQAGAGGVWDDKACAIEPLDGTDGVYPYICEFTLL